MAMIECKECHAEISDKAAFCPHCGAKMPKPKLWLWIPLGLIAFLVLIVAMQPKDERIERARNFTASVQRMMKDPKSFDVVELRISNTGAICLTYRAKNSFNAFVQGYAVKTTNGEVQIDGIDGTKKGLWAGYCSSGDGRTVHY